MRLLASLLTFVLLTVSGLRALEPYDLRCDWGTNPIGVDSTPPRLSWKLRSDPASPGDQRQTAWQVLVASSRAALDADSGDLWDSGRVTGDDQVHVPYAGRPLASSQQVLWKIRVWDAAHTASSWSEPATWTMGALDEAAWAGARWIADSEAQKWQRKALGFRSPRVADERTIVWLQVDLGQAQPIDSVRLHSIRHTVADQLGFPRGFKIEIADDPEMRGATAIPDHTARDFPNPWTSRIEAKPAGGSVTGRYVRLTATHLRDIDGEKCLALSQLVVMSGGKNIAPGSHVTASDSVEDASWSRASVVDGIGAPGANPGANNTLRLRRDFTVRPGLRRATLHVSGLGTCNASLNGAPVAPDALMTPGWTETTKTVLYDSHDLTARLRPGANALGLTLAGGMYNIQGGGRYTKFGTAFRPLTAIAVLRLDYAEGPTEHIVTNESWRVHEGPTTYANMFGGEDYDARLETPGWDHPGFDDSSWRPAVLHAGPAGNLRGYSHASPPFTRFEVFQPVKSTTLRPGVTVHDFGQNASMLLRLRVRGPRGAVVKAIPAELLKDDGSVERSSSGGDDVWWTYTLAGSSDGEAWAPSFFYHGSRYVQVELSAPEGAPVPEIESIESVVTHSDSRPAGDFACSNELFNRIRTLVRWAQRSNLAHVLTDCPHRERLGWLEQYHLNGPALRYETDLTRLFLKTFNDMADAQTSTGLVPDVAPEYVVFAGGFRDSPEWGAAVILAAWQHYVWTGDDTPLRRNYPVMQRYIAYLDTKARNRILSHGLGDWYDIGPGRPGVAQLTPIAVTATAIYYECVSRLAEIARHLGRAEDVARYSQQASEIAIAFNGAFFHPDSGTYATGSQTAQAMPLVLGLVPDQRRAAVLEALVSDIRQRGHAVTAGDIGYRYLLRALADGGRSDVIDAMNNQSEKPGYGYQLALGATSLTEAWTADRRSGQNHFMLGQITEWFFADLAGLVPDPRAPGFKNIIIRPRPVEGITWARASHETPRGRASVSWKFTDGNFALEVEVPVGATADVFLPFGPAEPKRTGSGRHTFSVAVP